MFTVKRGDNQYNAQDIATLQQWANAGSVLASDMIFDPQSNQWVQAGEFAPIRDILAQKAGGAQAGVQGAAQQAQVGVQSAAGALAAAGSAAVAGAQAAGPQAQAQQQQAQQAAQQAAAQQAAQQAAAQFIIVNTEKIPGREIENVVCLVQGSTVRAKNIGKDWLAGFKNLVGGEVSEYTELLQEARRIATDRMVQQAMSVGANGVINTRYTTSSVAQGMSEILAYGTAVKLKPVK